MKRKLSILTILTILAFFFASCADGIKGSFNDGAAGISGTGTSTGSGSSSTDNGSETGGGSSSSSADENDPFAGSTWICDQSNAYMTLKTTIKFSSDGNVNYSMDAAGAVTSIYSGPYTVKKDFNDVSGQYAAVVGSQHFTIPNKDATTTTFGGKTFKKQ